MTRASIREADVTMASALSVYKQSPGTSLYSTRCSHGCVAADNAIYLALEVFFFFFFKNKDIEFLKKKCIITN